MQFSQLPMCSSVVCRTLMCLHSSLMLIHAFIDHLSPIDDIPQTLIAQLHAVETLDLEVEFLRCGWFKPSLPPYSAYTAVGLVFTWVSSPYCHNSWATLGPCLLMVATLVHKFRRNLSTAVDFQIPKSLEHAIGLISFLCSPPLSPAHLHAGLGFFSAQTRYPMLPSVPVQSLL